MRRRRLAVALVLLGGTAAGSGLFFSGAGGGRATRAAPATLRLSAGGATLARIPAGRYVRAGALQLAALSTAVSEALPQTGTVADGRIQRTYAYDAPATVRRALVLGSRGGTVAVVRRAISTRIPAPVRRQQRANTCEAAALSILLSTVGRVVSEAQIQQALPVSGTTDPQGAGAAEVWGDPDRGYVGRPDGGGLSGGFGVYPGPVIAVAKRFGVRLRQLTGQPSSSIYDSLLQGHAVMAWVGLSAGPTGTWTSPQGRPITVNFGEHTVVLHGIRSDGSVLVSNPLTGTRETWTPATFERMWALLGDRAVGT